MSTPEQRLIEIGLELPEAAAPLAAYAPTSQVGSVVHVSGQLPLSGGGLVAEGVVGDNVDEETARRCARACAVNVLAQLRRHAGSLDRVRPVRLGVFVASDAAFTAEHRVADGASTLLAEIFVEDPPHARAAVGVACLPMNAPVEVEATADLRDAP